MSIALFVLGVVLIALGVFVSVVLHEFGHFIPAKLFGARVPQFFFGAGRTLWSFRRGETEFGIKAIPLMGYVQIVGMVPPRPGDAPGTVPAASTSVLGRLAEDQRAADHEHVRPEDEHRLFYKLPVWQRVVIMLGGPLVNLTLGVVLMSVVVMGLGTMKPTTTVSAVSQCVQSTAASTGECTAKDPVAPALKAGLKPGDKIISFNGHPVSAWEDLQQQIRASASKAVPVTVERDGKEVSTTITPMLTQRPELNALGEPVKNADGTYRTQEVGFIGVASQSQMVPGTFGDVMVLTGQTLKSVANIILHLPQRLYQVAQAAFGSEARDPNGPISVVGVGRIGGEITADVRIPVLNKIASVLGILGSLNLALFAFNLVPLTPLDGGNIAAALWDGIRTAWARLRGKPEPHPFDTAKLAPLSMAVFGIFAVMSLLLIYADIVKPVSLQ